MILLIAGLALWVAAHLFKRLLPSLRARLGAAGKGGVAVASLAATLLMGWGYATADFIQIYDPLPGMGHLNNTLMLVAIYLLGVGHAKGRLSQKIRHPMLLSVVVWAVAHLAVNGDLASVILFGGLGLWALATILVINAQEGAWVPSGVVRARGDWVNIAITLVVYGLIAAIHIWAGHNPFLGNYA